LRVRLRGVELEPRGIDCVDLRGAVPAQGFRMGADPLSNQGHADLAPELLREPDRFRERFQARFLEFSVPYFREDENIHQRTLASSLRRRTSSGTASTPFPTILPGGRSGGISSFTISIDDSTAGAATLSTGFVFAAMMPFIDGNRLSWIPLTPFCTEMTQGSETSIVSSPPSICRRHFAFAPSTSKD